jgi:hypothetical protein
MSNDARSPELIQSYLKSQADKEHSPSTQLLALNAYPGFNVPETNTTPVDPALVMEAHKELRIAMTSGLNAGVPGDFVLNSVLIFGLVWQRTGLTQEQIAPLARHIAELWDEHDCSMCDAAIKQIAEQVVQLYEKSLHRQ